MMERIPPPNNSNGYQTRYVIDIESGAETARLEAQDTLVTRHMGGLFPADLNLDGVHEILDVSCGPGSWTLEAAFKHPGWHVVGVDLSETMTKYAAAAART